MAVYPSKFGIARFGQSFFGERNPQTWIKEADIDIDRETDLSIGETN